MEPAERLIAIARENGCEDEIEHVLIGELLPAIRDEVRKEVLAEDVGGRWMGKTRDEVIAILEERLGRRGRELNEAIQGRP